MKTHFIVETWVLFRKNDEVVSNVVMEAYGHYEDMEFGEEKDEKSIGDPQRNIKLINIAKKKRYRFRVVASSLAKSFRSTSFPVRFWQISLRKIGDKL